MALYHLFYQRDDEFIGPLHCQFADDLDALDFARAQCADHPVQVWEGDRFVARLKQGDEPLNVTDAYSGQSTRPENSLRKQSADDQSVDT